VPYFYAVTPYRIEHGTYTTLKVARPPLATEQQMVVLSPGARPDLSEIRIIPNPYKGRAGWDLTPTASDPTGSKIGIFGLPRAESTIQIFTLAGDLVQTLYHDGRGGNGAVYWDLRTRRGQDAATGVYIVTVQSQAKLWKGHLILIR
jgi:hypothetical protein